MKINLLVGLWHDHLAIQCSREEQAEIEATLETTRFEVLLDEKNHTVSIWPSTSDADGKCFHLLSTTQEEAGHGQALLFSKDLALESIARFALTPVDFELTDLGVLHARIDADYKLPWPKLRDCQSYYTPDEMFRQVMLRRRHALEAGEKRMPSIPDKWLEQIGAENRIRIFSQSKEIKEGMTAAA